MGWIENCRVFCQVVESGGFTRAAEVLHMPRSTVSTVVSGLEARLGVQLLHRTTRRVGLTREGEIFYDRCAAFLLQQIEMETMFRSQGDRITGRISVSVPSRIGRLVLIPALPGFLRDWPVIRVEVGLADRSVDVPAEQVDCVLRIGAIPTEGLKTRLLGQLGQINVASPDYLKAYGTPLSPADLPAHRQVGYISPTTGRVMEWDWVEGGECRNFCVPWHVSADTGEGYIACALKGLGMIQIPAYDVADQLRTGELVEVMPDFRPAPLPIILGLRCVHPIPPARRIFADWMENLIREQIAQ